MGLKINSIGNKEKRKHTQPPRGPPQTLFLIIFVYNRRQKIYQNRILNDKYSLI